jgi:c(7)-type cytochrome triheme protein
MRRVVNSVLLGALLTGLSFSYITFAEQQPVRKWKSIKDDGIHDPNSSAIGVLQNPAEALSVLPPDTAGNQVSWVKALRDGHIKPRTHLNKQGKLERLDSNIIMKDTLEMPNVLFPHRAHTEWMDCASCHDHIFKSKAGETPVNMFAILQGKYCGRCHGAVAFPLTECDRCHSVGKKRKVSK